MSYHAEISFKTIGITELYQFLQKIKDTASKHIDKIAEDEFLYMPSVRYDHLYKEVRSVVARDADEAWAKSAVFTMRFFYLAEHNLLGVFGVPSAVQECFDATIYFQNSTDQDYEYDEWKDVPIFAQIADRWKASTDEDVLRKYNADRNDDEMDTDDFDYYRRTFAYEEIWAMCEDYMWNDNQAVHLSLFSYYDFQTIMQFVEACKEKYEQWRGADNA